jgi:F-type H+-transporting ATPase subunit gamma
MAGTLRELRQRLRATRKVLQVTQALERISSARMLRSRALLAAHEPYSRGLCDVLGGVALALESRSLPLFKARPEGRIGILALGSDRGLCGSHNSAIMDALQRLVERHGKDKVGLFVMGKVIRDRVRRLGLAIDHFLPQPALQGYEVGIAELVKSLASRFRAGAYGEMHVLHMEYLSGLKQVPKVMRLLPLPFGEAPESPDLPAAARAAVYEPEPETILRHLASEFLRTTLAHAFLHSLVCEHSARNASMARATDNAREMIDSMTIEYHRLRQEDITTEMTEIAAGANFQ